MARRTTKKKGPTPEEEAKEFFTALDMIEEEKGISKAYMMEKITQALVSAYKRDHEGAEENIVVLTDPEKNSVRIIVRRDVVEEVTNPDTEISLEEARRFLPAVQLGDVVSSEIKPKNFGRIAAQTARQVIIQGIREAERNMVYEEFVGKTQELLTGVVTRIDPRSGALHVKIGSGRESTEALLTAKEQVPGESYREGDRIKVYVVEVRRGTRGTQVLISRTHYGLVRRLFEMEVPEIYDGVVEIRSIAREAGSRTKMAVWSNDEEVDPIGACVGTRGARVNTIVEELNGEKVDIIKYSEDPAEFISAALSPADVLDVRCRPEEKTCRVVVPDDQLSLAIGKEGQNARLAAKLTGYKIDIKSESAAAEETEADEMSLFEDEDDLFADEAPETEAAEPAVEADAEEPEELVDEAEEAQDAETVENSEESVENWEEPEAVATDETAEETQAEEL
ncbi:MAG: transcription termination factor NusA [Candidatus Onthomonas sp.]|nr:transcription termination factor NusA [Candidatus Onthomonas sp.]